MTEDYRPFRDIHTIDDLRLVRASFESAPATVTLSEAFYPDVCAWVTLDAPADVLFGDAPRVVMECDAWRLLLTEHGYLRFESDVPDTPEAQSYVPAHAAVGSRGMRLGVAICNSARALRDTEYAAEASSVSSVRLLAGPADGRLSRIGEAVGWLAPELAPAPERLTVALGPGEVEAFNCFEADSIALGGARPASDVLPLAPGGSSFGPRWIDERTVEVFTRPEFLRSSSYWVFLRVERTAPMPERLIVRTMHVGGANMTPTFFASPDRENWRRVAPLRVWLDRQGGEFAAEFDASEVADGWLASSPPFGDAERESLLAWAGQIPSVDVREIGASVEGRALHSIRIGDGPRGVAIICGQHSPLEIMGGRVIEPMIRALLERRDLLAATSFIFIPTVNVDCAHYGGNGLNAAQRNLNRHWMVDLEPETLAVIDHITSLCADGLELELGIDVHAGGIFRNHVLMHPADGEVEATGLDAIEHWRDLLERHAGLRRADGWGLAQNHLRASDWLQQEIGATGFCLELSTCSYFDPREGRTREFSADALDLLAEGIVGACEEFFL